MDPIDAAGPARLEWRVHPYAERRALGHAALAVILVAGALAAVTLRSGLAGVAVAGLLFTSTHSFFLPARWSATPEGLTVERIRMRTFLPWSRFRSVRRAGNSLWLSPYRGGGWLSRMRAVRLDLPQPGE